MQKTQSVVYANFKEILRPHGETDRDTIREYHAEKTIGEILETSLSVFKWLKINFFINKYLFEACKVDILYEIFFGQKWYIQERNF